MRYIHGKRSVWGIALLLAVVGTAKGVEISQAEWDAMKKSQAEWDETKKEIEELRNKQRKEAAAVGRNETVEKALETKGYGPNVGAKTNGGKLTVGGLLQIWYYAPQTDHRSLFDDQKINNVSDTNEWAENNSFRIRRAQLQFTMDIHENVTSYVMIDPAKETSGNFPIATDNQINTGYIYKAVNNVGSEYQGVLPTGTKTTAPNTPGFFGSTSRVTGIQSGSASSAVRLLQDAWVDYHGVIPHHDFKIGQFIPLTGEEGVRSGEILDFAERSFCGLLDNRRDLGAAIHGTWWDDRFQYWGGVYDGGGDFFGVQDTINRPDNNSSKDVGYRLLLRPVYKNETWGNLEIGGGELFGYHGNSGTVAPLSAPDNGLDRTKTNAFSQSAWLFYRPGAEVVGLWLRGEWKLVRDRMPPGTVIDPYGDGTKSSSLYTQQLGKPFSTSGFYTALGYKLSESTFQDSCPSWLKPFEFLGRYQQFENVLLADPNNPTHTDIYTTKVVTGGINYYIKGHDAKIQANYNFVYNPKLDNNPNLSFHNTKDDSLVVNFQVAF